MKIMAGFNAITAFVAGVVFIISALRGNGGDWKWVFVFFSLAVFWGSKADIQ